MRERERERQLANAISNLNYYACKLSQLYDT